MLADSRSGVMLIIMTGCFCLVFFIPPLNEVEMGVYLNGIVHLSVCPSVDITPLTFSRVQFFSDSSQTW